MKHIVFIIGNYKNGGVAMRSTNLANEFAKAGYLCTILATKEIAENVFFKRHKNVELISLENYILQHNSDSDVLKAFKNSNNRIRFLKHIRYVTNYLPKTDKKLEQKIKKLRIGKKLLPYTIKNPNSLYITFGIASFERVFCATMGLSSKILYAERNAPELEFPADEIEKKHIFKMLLDSCGIILQTKDEMKFFNEYFDNTAVINNPVKANLPAPYQGERKNVIVNFCRIAEQKNLPLMIKAFLEFHKIHPEYTLEIYGNTVEKTEEDLKSSYLEMISSLNAEKYIKILPPRADVHEVIKDCAMFVSSSDYEGLSNSMLEAMAIGLPCVCTDCLGGGAREMITDGENGLLVPMNDVDMLAQAMCRIVEDEELSKKISKNAAKVRETHKVEVIAKKWLEIIEKSCN